MLEKGPQQAKNELSLYCNEQYLTLVIQHLLSKDALIASLSCFFPLPPDFRRPLFELSVTFVQYKNGGNFESKNGDYSGNLPKVWKSSFWFSCRWLLIWLLWNETIIISLSNNVRESPAIAATTFGSCIPLSSLPLPLDSLFLTLCANPEGECDEDVSFGGDKEGLPVISTLSPCDGDKDGLLESSALLLDPSLAIQAGSGRDRLSWMDLLLLGDSCSSCSSSSSVSCGDKANYLQG